MALQAYSLLGDGDTISSTWLAELVRLSSNNDFVSVKAYSFGEMLFSDWRENHPREFTMHPACVCSPSSNSISQNNSENNTAIESKINENQRQNTENQLNISQSEVQKAEITLKPNPTTGELKIESGEWKIKEVVVFDVVGKELLRVSTINNLQTTLNIEFLHNGMYFIKITTEDGMQQMKKIVKE